MADPDPEVASAGVKAEIARITSDVLHQWRQHLRRDGDDHARSGERGESEHLLVSTLLRTSSSKDDAMLPALAAAAARYGAEQRRARLDPGGLCEELSSLRQIVWSEIKSHGPDVRDAVDRILRFDRALSIVVKAALTAGYSEKTLATYSACAEANTREGESIEPRAPNE